jgi:hypothetical protein
MKGLVRWFVVACACLLMILGLRWFARTSPEAAVASATPTQGPPTFSRAEAVARFRERVDLVLAFQSEGFERKGVPSSQLATIPPVWTGEKVRGEKDGTPLSHGAVIMFTSKSDGTLIVVDIAYVEGLTGQGILRTAWIDDEVTRKAGTCTSCSGHSVMQFYEQGLVYTLTAMRPDGKPGSLYRFAGDLMQTIREHPFAE